MNSQWKSAAKNNGESSKNTAGRAAFITGQSPFRTGLTKVGLPGSDLGLQPEDPTIAEYLKAKGFRTGQFGNNHLGDLDEHLPTNHGFDEFFGNPYHLTHRRQKLQRERARSVSLAGYSASNKDRGRPVCSSGS